MYELILDTWHGILETNYQIILYLPIHVSPFLYQDFL